MQTNFDAMKIEDLKNLARNMGYKNYSKLRKTDLIVLISTKKRSVKKHTRAYYNNMTNRQLKDIAKQKSFVKYSTMNKRELINLLVRGVHPKPRQKKIYEITDYRNLLPLDYLFTSCGCINHVYGYGAVQDDEKGGYVIRGVNLNGMFDSIRVPDKTINVLENDYEDINTADYEWFETDETTQVVTKTIKGGWFVPFASYQNFSDYTNRLKTIRCSTNPKSLFELAAYVLKSRKITAFLHPGQYIPTIIKLRLKSLKF